MPIRLESAIYREKNESGAGESMRQGNSVGPGARSLYLPPFAQPCRIELMTDILILTEVPMKMTAVIERDGDGYVSLCPELDIASQGKTIEDARDNLREALELFFESASPDEIKQRLREEVFVTQVEVTVG